MGQRIVIASRKGSIYIECVVNAHLIFLENASKLLIYAYSM